MTLKHFLAAACVAMNCGCAAFSPDCAQNWYESGQRHGRLGIQPWDVQYAAACGSRFNPARYVAGFQAGASERPAQPGS